MQIPCKQCPCWNFNQRPKCHKAGVPTIKTLCFSANDSSCDLHSGETALYSQGTYIDHITNRTIQLNGQCPPNAMGGDNFCCTMYILLFTAVGVSKNVPKACVFTTPNCKAKQGLKEPCNYLSQGWYSVQFRLMLKPVLSQRKHLYTRYKRSDVCSVTVTYS